jgi:hypothetical protein
MGNTIDRHVKSVKGLETCPHTRFQHEHKNEIDICDACEKERMCRVACAYPKGSEIYRVCLECDRKGLNKYKKIRICSRCNQEKVCNILDQNTNVCSTCLLASLCEKNLNGFGGSRENSVSDRDGVFREGEV